MDMKSSLKYTTLTPDSLSQEESYDISSTGSMTVDTPTVRKVKGSGLKSCIDCGIEIPSGLRCKPCNKEVRKQREKLRKRLKKPKQPKPEAVPVEEEVVVEEAVEEGLFFVGEPPPPLREPYKPPAVAAALTCQWPMWGMERIVKNYTFCGDKSEKGKSYCGKHCKLAYNSIVKLRI